MGAGITKKELMAKARGFTMSIGRMDEKQRSDTPSGEYGRDYNSLRALTAELCPNLAKILPPAVTFYGGGSDRSFTTQSYGEIDTYCEQIFQLLSELE